MDKLPRSYYEQDSLTLAKDLLGKYLVHAADNGTTIGKIIETEAYRGPLDAAAHSYSGKPTARTKIMFGPGGLRSKSLFTRYKKNTYPAASNKQIALRPISRISVIAIASLFSKL